MAITQNTFNGNGSNLGPFSFTFKWLRASDIKVTVNNVLKTAGTHYNLQSLNYTTKTGGEVLFTAGNAPPVGTSNIRVYRDTDDSTLVATFSSGSAIRAADLNSNFTQELYRVQETTNYSVQDIGSVTLAATYTFTYSPSGPTPTLSGHFATKGYVDGVALAGTVPDGDRGDITVSSTGTVWTIDNLAVTAAKIANSTITTGKLSFNVAQTDIAQSYTKAQRGTPVALTDGATITPDFSLGNNFSVTLAGNRTLANPTNLTAGQSGTIVITQDATGSRTLAYGAYWKFPGGTAPTLTTTASAVDVLAYYVESSTRITARLISDVK